MPRERAPGGGDLVLHLDRAHAPVHLEAEAVAATRATAAVDRHDGDAQRAGDVRQPGGCAAATERVGRRHPLATRPAVTVTAAAVSSRMG